MKITKNKLKNILSIKKSYLRWSSNRIAKQFKVSDKIALKAKKETIDYLKTINLNF